MEMAGLTVVHDEFAPMFRDFLLMCLKHNRGK